MSNSRNSADNVKQEFDEKDMLEIAMSILKEAADTNSESEYILFYKSKKRGIGYLTTEKDMTRVLGLLRVIGDLVSDDIIENRSMFDGEEQMDSESEEKEDVGIVGEKIKLN